MVVKPSSHPTRYLRNLPYTWGTVGHWMLGGSGIAKNIAESGAPDLTQAAGPTHTVEAVGKTAVFVAASSQYFGEATLSPTLDLKGPMTISALFRAGGGYIATQTIAGSGTAAGSATYFLEFGRTDNKFTWIHGGSIVFTSNFTLSDDVWRRVTMVRVGKPAAWELRFFVDGTLDTVATTATNPQAAAAGFSVGRAGAFNGNYMTGAVAECRVWKRALSDMEVLSYTANPYAELVQQRRQVFVPAGVVATSAELNSQGTSAATFNSGAAASSSLNAAGTGAASFGGQAAATSVLNAAGTSTASFVGEASAAGAGAMSAQGTSTAEFGGAARASAAMDAQGDSSAIFVGSSGDETPQTFEGRIPARRRIERERRRERDLRDMRDILALIEAMPPGFLTQARGGEFTIGTVH